MSGSVAPEAAQASALARAPLRIAMATDWFLPRLGGIELQLAELTSRLAAAGHRVTVLTSTPGAEAPKGVRLVALDTARLPMVDVAASPRLPGMLEQRLKEGGYDVVHAHVSVVSPVALGAALVACRLGLPVVVTFHSMLHAGAVALSLADRIWRWTAWPVVLSAVSRTVASQVGRAARGRTVEVLPNGIELGTWREWGAAPGRRDSTCTFVSTMRLHRKKRPAALLRAFARARSAAPAVELRLVVIGDGPQRTELEELAVRLGIARQVRFTGRLPRRRIAEEYAEAQAFVSATLHESFGIAALEARAAELPVIAMRRSGATEFLTHDANALLADSDQELAQQIAALAADPALRARLGGHTGDVDRFAWEAVIRRHLRIYAEAARLTAASRD